MRFFEWWIYDDTKFSFRNSAGSSQLISNISFRTKAGKDFQYHISEKSRQKRASSFWNQFQASPMTQSRFVAIFSILQPSVKDNSSNFSFLKCFCCCSMFCLVASREERFLEPEVEIADEFVFLIHFLFFRVCLEFLLKLWSCLKNVLTSKKHQVARKLEHPSRLRHSEWSTPSLDSKMIQDS